MLIESRSCMVEDRPQEDDPRVIAALEEYLEACEQGRRPRKARFLRRHPEIAGHLEECLEGLDCLQNVAHHFGAQSSGSDATAPRYDSLELRPDQRLGDYQLVREIGRGGMGVVFEAIQLSLGRRVAIKLLPSSAAIDPKQLQRFQVEAQAAAQLHHPHIVPVFAVGREAGLHYYVMQLIGGRTLAAAIADRRLATEKSERDGLESDSSSPSMSVRTEELPGEPAPSDRSFFHAAAGLGLQAASALAYAHRLGIVHRDIKPSNLLIDDCQKLWVADFGLASLPGEGGITATGDVVGTLRYMSPEQALARKGVVDHRTDQYSLGATMYELVTAHPVFEGADLQALVSQITRDEPRPPSKLNTRVPRDLETIILKAMAKEPVNRYATMQELADDLSRFIDDQPIHARRPCLVERAARWQRRHRALMLSGTAVLLLALICLSISVFVIWSAMTRIKEVAQANSVELNRSHRNLELATRALDLYLNTAESWYPRDPRGSHEEKERLRSALAFYEQIASQNLDNPAVKRRTFAAYCRVGDIHTSLGDCYGAEDAYRKALAVMEELRAGQPESDPDLISQAVVLEKFAGLFRKMRSYGPAEWSLDEAVRLLDRVVQKQPQDTSARLALAHALNLNAALKGETGRTALALREIGQALRLLEAPDCSGVEDGEVTAAAVRREMASAHLNMGKWLQLEERLSEAECYYESALGLLTQLAADETEREEVRESLASCRAMLGELSRLTRRSDVAETHFKLAIEALELLIRDYPRIPRYREQAARVYGMLSTLYSTTERPDESAKALDLAIAYDPKLPGNHKVQLNNMAWYLVTSPVPAARNPARGLDLARRAVSLAPSCWESWNTLGVALFRNQDWDDALKALRTAVDMRPGTNAFDGFFLAMTHWRLGNPAEARTWFRNAEEWRLREMRFDVELLRFRYEAEQLIGTIVVGQANEPALPGSISEALRDPSFRLPRLAASPNKASAGCDGPAQGRNRRSDKLAIFDFAEHVLLFSDVT